MSDVAAPAAPETASPAAPEAKNDAPAAKAAPKAPPADPSVPQGASKLVGEDKKDAKAPEAKKEAPPPAEKRKYKLKVDGAEEELELSDEEISVRLQKERAAGKRMQEAAELRKQFQQAVELIKKDPFSALKDPAFGVDLDALAEQRLIEKYKAELMTPEERQRAEMESQLKKYQEQEKETQAAQEKQAQEAYNQRVYQETEASFLEALKQEGVTQDYETLLQMVDIAKMNLDYGIELTPAQMAAEVKAKRGAMEEKARTAITSKYASLKGDDLLSTLGESIVNEVLRASVAKLKGTQTFGVPAPKQAAEPEEKPRNSMSPAEFRRAMGLK